MSTSTTVPCATCQQECCFDFSHPLSVQTHASCCKCGEYHHVLLAPNKVYHRGTILAQIEETSGGVVRGTQIYDTYDPAATNGLQNPVFVLMRDTLTNDKGYDKYSDPQMFACTQVKARVAFCVAIHLDCLEPEVKAQYYAARNTNFIDRLLTLGETTIAYIR